ncbi:hypothetical protein SAMN02799636_05549 [Methylobacterium sp. 275MFSha3.1]|uniref:hypothetical protein n=1 Tax=Methylobacterium sp. 275MFSha3.1 TaxID=1502746 RepID=UPI0008A7382F|nr:hypothetical protein [Methylobacterium sp. 275MFSha3.1]SEI10236.1 hypothetical protein SAMN02799636_05549 [Methylobacterium sp. 275MFSha3.1]
MSVESAAIVRATVMSRPGAVANMVAGNLWRALGAHAPDTDVSSEFPPYSAIFEVIALKFGPQALAAFQASAQMRDVVPHRLIRTADTVLIALAWVLAAATCMVALVRGERALAALRCRCSSRPACWATPWSARHCPACSIATRRV